MSKYDLTQGGYVFRYTTGAFVSVHPIDAPDGVPYDMMQIPEWVNRASFDQTVLYQVAHEWLARYGPVGSGGPGIERVDRTELRAHLLHAALTQRGVLNTVHWDRSPWGVRIPLTSSVAEDRPALYVLTEGPQQLASVPHDEPVWVWDGALGDFDDEGSMDLADTWLKWIERHWLNDYTDSVAAMIVPVVQILKLGAASAYQARRFRVTGALDPEEVETALRTLAEVYENTDDTGRYLSSHQQEVAAKVLGLATVIQ